MPSSAATPGSSPRNIASLKRLVRLMILALFCMVLHVARCVLCVVVCLVPRVYFCSCEETLLIEYRLMSISASPVNIHLIESRAFRRRCARGDCCPTKRRIHTPPPRSSTQAVAYVLVRSLLLAAFTPVPLPPNCTRARAAGKKTITQLSLTPH